MRSTSRSARRARSSRNERPFVLRLLIYPANGLFDMTISPGLGVAGGAAAFVAAERAGGERSSGERGRGGREGVVSERRSTPQVMSATDGELRVDRGDAGWRLVGEGFDGVQSVNDFLGYLVDRNYAVLTVRAYAFDLLHFGRWMVSEELSIDAVDTDVLLRYLTACRKQLLAHQRGGNVFSIRDGRSTGYSPRTVNRRLAALSGLFTFRGMRDPMARNPIPRRRDAGAWSAPGQRAGLLGHLAPASVPRSGLRLREPRRLPRVWTATRSASCSRAFTRFVTGRSPV